MVRCGFWEFGFVPWRELEGRGFLQAHYAALKVCGGENALSVGLCRQRRLLQSLHRFRLPSDGGLPEQETTATLLFW